MTKEITTHEDYLEVLAQIDVLFEDYDANRPQIDLLTPLLERYEEHSAHFAAFNQSAARLSTTESLLRVLMDQSSLETKDFLHKLGLSEDIESHLNGQQTLTCEQLSMLCKRYPALFDRSKQFG
ncbi:Putative transcription regulator containing HTH domain protein [Rheinheimera sp. A13L]|uniref:Putative transcription regulator containing HTH domain protein n=1 Tax=Rheinheimera sp. A13L TaxID=506534 RepID=UPI000212570B|nr:Putative transcription regulator containing HTH domain protein [Rheinheimera sp. A13L]EGM76660.1 Putative transcription regulator containing HTH domain protein [Rheinheimera sp. A13L]